MSHSIDGQPKMIQNVFVLLLLAVFAVMSTLLVTMGAQLYRATVDQASGNNNIRILSAVVRSAVWAEDGGDVTVETYEEHGIDVLAIAEHFDDEVFVKRLFCHDGYLWESYTSGSRAFDIESGESLCELQAFAPQVDGRKLSIHLTAADGEEYDIIMSMRAGGGVE